MERRWIRAHSPQSRSKFENLTSKEISCRSRYYLSRQFPNFLLWEMLDKEEPFPSLSSLIKKLWRKGLPIGCLAEVSWSRRKHRKVFKEWWIHGRLTLISFWVHSFFSLLKVGNGYRCCLSNEWQAPVCIWARDPHVWKKQMFSLNFLILRQSRLLR